MATKITLIRSSSLEGLEWNLNEFFDQHADDDTRHVVELIGGVSYVNDEFVAMVRFVVPYKRRFVKVEEDEGC